MQNRGFWDKLKYPIIGLSPMDGVTDSAFRFIVDKYGKPDVLFTEFTSVEGLSYGAAQLLSAFVYHKTDTPTTAQVFGSHPGDFYKAAFIISELGFDGIDINMGCPDRHVAKKGGGAGLILRPKLAQEIIKRTKQGTEDWGNGTSLHSVGIKPSIIDWIDHYKEKNSINAFRKPLPVSVKTRIGYDEVVTESWVSNLLEAEPANISLHGRTLKQLYSGEADWNEIENAARLTKTTSTTLLGNGDIKSLADAREKIVRYHVDGVLIGRAAFGNPWVFVNKEGTLQERFQTAIEHCQKFMELTPDLHFLSLRKHLAWYCKGFDGAAKVRTQFLSASNLSEVESIIASISE